MLELLGSFLPLSGPHPILTSAPVCVISRTSVWHHSDIRTLEEDPGAAMEFARSKSEARKEGLTGGRAWGAWVGWGRGDVGCGDECLTCSREWTGGERDSLDGT